MPQNRRLIIDVGMSEGNDTAFYLAKGFDVVGVEADPALAAPLRERFAEAIAAGRLRLLERAAAARSGALVSFWHDAGEQGHSSLDLRGRDGRVTEFKVTTIDWRELSAVGGVPYYLKIDIEGGEPAFLSGMVGAAELPLYISSEIQSFRPVELLRDIGYRHFRLINQDIWAGLALPDPPLEGVFVPRPAPHHWSGPFGRELPGKRWFSFNETKAIYDTVHRLWEFGTLITGWMDCHACLPEAAG
jgi:FkbM family methyltransferase